MSPCIIPPYAVTALGHCVVVHEGRRIPRHRLAWINAYGPLTSRQLVHHKCRNRACVNLEHLEVVTQGEHAKRHRGDKCKERGHDPRYVRYGNQDTCLSCIAWRRSNK